MTTNGNGHKPTWTTKRGAAHREEILAYIAEFVVSHGYPPTIREICAGVGADSTSTVEYHLKRLARDGRLTRVPTLARSIRLVEPTAT